MAAQFSRLVRPTIWAVSWHVVAPKKGTETKKTEHVATVVATCTCMYYNVDLHVVASTCTDVAICLSERWLCAAIHASLTAIRAGPADYE